VRTCRLLISIQGLVYQWVQAMSGVEPLSLVSSLIALPLAIPLWYRRYELIRGRRKHLQNGLIKVYLFQSLRALAHMHEKGVFHRDIKPENILVESSYDVYSGLKLADFGSCRGIYSRQPYTVSRTERDCPCKPSNAIFLRFETKLVAFLDLEWIIASC